MIRMPTYEVDIDREIERMRDEEHCGPIHLEPKFFYDYLDEAAEFDDEADSDSTEPVIEKMKTFHDLLIKGPNLDCELIITGCEMPASFVWNSEQYIREYGVEKYRAILEAPFTILSNGNIEIECDDERLGEAFVLAAAGYISSSEYDKIFGEVEF